MVAPAAGHVQEVLRFAGEWRQEKAPLLIHCWAGISRSTAAAYATVCALNPERDEEEDAPPETEVRPPTWSGRLAGLDPVVAHVWRR